MDNRSLKKAIRTILNTEKKVKLIFDKHIKDQYQRPLIKREHYHGR